MIKDEQIPEEVLRALCASMGWAWAMQDGGGEGGG